MMVSLVIGEVFVELRIRSAAVLTTHALTNWQCRRAANQRIREAWPRVTSGARCCRPTLPSNTREELRESTLSSRAQ